jgi:hypothetical protein
MVFPSPEAQPVRIAAMSPPTNLALKNCSPNVPGRRTAAQWTRHRWIQSSSGSEVTMENDAANQRQYLTFFLATSSTPSAC